MFIGYFQNYRIYKSDKPLKKYYALVGDKKIYFGETGYEQFFDVMQHYSKYNHLDKNRRRLYYARHGFDAAIASPKWFSHNVLWSLSI
jgi:capsid portal protein